MNPVKPIRTGSDHEEALREIESLLESASPDSPEEDRLDVLTTLVERYEAEHLPLPDVEPVAVLEAVMEERGYTKSDLARVLGSRPRATEILKRQRGLSVEHIRAIRREWGVPADALI